MLAKRGVTSIKDIGFDQHSGLLPVLEELEAAGELPLRFHFALEPVLQPIDIPAGIQYKERYQGRFSAFRDSS